MPSSFSETINIACPRCGHTFPFEVWLIVATDERPDLTDRIRADTLHAVTCPQCRQDLGALDAPLLLYWPHVTPPILFSPAQQTTHEQNQEQAIGLVSLLCERLGDTWRDEWLDEGLSSVDRTMLPIALADDSEAAQRDLQVRMQAELSARREHDSEGFAQREAQAQPMRGVAHVSEQEVPGTPDPSFTETLRAFLSADSWDESYRLVQDHPELLSDAALALLDKAITAAQEEGNPRAVAFCTEHRDLLHRCIELGADVAFAEKLGLTVEQLQDTNSTIDLPLEAQAVIDELAREGQITSREELERRLNARPDLRERLERALSGPDDHGNVPHEVQQIITQITQLNRIPDMPRRVERCRAALTLVSRETHPVLWATLQSELGASLAQNPLGDRANNLEEAIAALTQALTVQTRQDMPDAWSQTSMILANSYYFRIRGDRSDNLEQAIATYERALTIWARDATPVQWATITSNLANAYRDRIRGNRADNLEASISAYQNVLTIYTREAMPIEWARANNNLAIAYYYRIRGDRADNLESAIAAYEQALTVFTRKAMPGDWAATIVNLANAYTARIRGDRADNLEQAIAAYQQALTVQTRHATPIDWARTIHNLAVSYAARIRGDRADNLERAITAYAQALTVLTREAMPIEWANATNHLATAYRNRIRGDHADNLERAITAYAQALTVLTREALPVEWARTTMNLANTYQNRIRGDRADNLERSISTYAQALTVMTREAMPVEWASATNNLAISYFERIRGERADNLERAIAAYEQALIIRTRNAMPLEWAETTVNLANAYAARMRGEHADNLETAIAAYKQALTVHTRDAMPIAWAQTTMNLATIYMRRIRGEAAENLETAIAAYKQALTVHTRDAMPIAWAQTTMNLALAYVARIEGDHADNFEQAITAYEQALTVHTRDTMPIAWAETTIGLAEAYHNHSRGEHAHNLERAIAAYEQALEVLQPTVLPVKCRLAARSLGNLYAEHGRWREAAAAYSQAVQAAEILYLASISQLGKEAELSENDDLYRRAAFALTHSGNRRRAVELLEHGRARGLGATLDRDYTDLVTLERFDADLARRYRAAAATLRQREADERVETSTTPTDQDPAATFVTRTAQARAARDELDSVIAAIRQIPGYADFLTLPDWDDIVGVAAPDTPLVYLATTPHGSLALIVPNGASEPEPLSLDGFTEGHLNMLLITRAGDIVGGYLPGQLGDHQQLSAALDAALPLLGAQLITPLATRLTQMQAIGVTLIPTGLLSLLPLHAATYAVDGVTSCLLDAFNVAYAPSVRVLAKAQQEAQRRSAGEVRLTGVGNPTRDLRYAGSELAAICDLLPIGASIPFYEAQATHNALRQALPGATIAHFSCHGSFAPDPLDSALHLAGGDRLTLRELVTGDLSTLAALRLVVMSACQTAITDFRRLPDESIGLPGGFLQAGVPAVVGTLWSVDDLSTALLMHRFYELHLQGDPGVGLGPQHPARSLRLAQRWLRDLTHQGLFDYLEQQAELLRARREEAVATRMPGALLDQGLLRAEQGLLDDPAGCPFASPVYWAAFTFSGAM